MAETKPVFVAIYEQLSLTPWLPQDEQLDLPALLPLEQNAFTRQLDRLLLRRCLGRLVSSAGGSQIDAKLLLTRGVPVPIVVTTTGPVHWLYRWSFNFTAKERTPLAHLAITCTETVRFDDTQTTLVTPSMWQAADKQIAAKLFELLLDNVVTSILNTGDRSHG